MTENAINAESEILELHELSSEELDVVAGGQTQSDALKVLQQILNEL
jgi:hypothetical protein